MPTPLDSSYDVHSDGGGLLGMDSLVNFFRWLDDPLSSRRQVESPTAAPTVLTTSPCNIVTCEVALNLMHTCGDRLPVIVSFAIQQYLPEGLPRAVIEIIEKQLQAQGSPINSYA